MRPIILIRALTAAVLLPAGPLPAHGQLETLIARATEEIGAAPNADKYLRRGELLRAHGRLEAALADYDAAEKLAPELPAIWLCRARTLLLAGNPGAALRAAERFTALVPDHAAGRRYLAEALRELGRHADAAAAFAEMLRVMPEPRPEDYIDTARAWQAAGQPGRGLETLDAGLKKLGPVMTLEMEAIQLSLAAGDTAAALTRTDRLEASARHKAPWQARRAEILSAAGREAEAVAAAKDALRSIESLPAGLRAAGPTAQWESRMRRLAGISVPTSNPR